LKIYKKIIISREEEIIEKVLKKIKKYTDKQCCEFGASNGILGSNTFNLIKNDNYSAILIEKNKKKFYELEKNFPEKKIIKLNKFVNVTGKDSLNNILKNTYFNKNFDFLSIDIDGNDYHVFNSLTTYIPKLICIEFNPTIPNDVFFIQKKDGKNSTGSSAKAILALGVKKNYFPIAATTVNLFFIHNLFRKLVTTSKTFDIENLIPNAKKNYIFSGYDGTIYTSEKFDLPWHKIRIKEFKALPFFLKNYPGNYNVFQIIFWFLLLFFLNPHKYLKKPLHYIKLFAKNIINRLM
jgi:hypothetical protein